MKSRWSIYVLAGVLAVAVLSLTVSPVAQTRLRLQEADDDDEDALDDPLPDSVELRVFIHRPRVLKPNHLGTCMPSVNANVDHFEVILVNVPGPDIPAHLPGPIVWRLNRSTVPSSVAGSVDSVLNQSANTWYTGIFSQGPDTTARRARHDNVNAILWKRLRRSTLGVTFTWYSRETGELLEADTVFNKRLPWAIFSGSPECQSSPDAYDLQNIATHEFGHWIGLDDLFDDSDRDLTMYGFGAGGEVKRRTLGTGDISGKNALEP